MPSNTIDPRDVATDKNREHVCNVIQIHLHHFLTDTPSRVGADQLDDGEHLADFVFWLLINGHLSVARMLGCVTAYTDILKDICDDVDVEELIDRS